MLDPKYFAFRPEPVNDGDAAYITGSIYALLGRPREAIVWLRRTAEPGDVNCSWFERDTTYDSVKRDPEYKTVMADVQKHWEANRREFEGAE